MANGGIVKPKIFKSENRPRLGVDELGIDFKTGQMWIGTMMGNVPLGGPSGEIDGLIDGGTF